MSLYHMHADETRALKRAALILLVVTALRWGWSARAGPSVPADESVLPELLESTREATEEGARRRAPLKEDERIDPNRASEVELDRLPGVGPSTARAIVSARDSGRVFRTPEDLLLVRGIGEGTLERMRAALELAAEPAAAARAGPTPRGPRVSTAGPGPPIDVNRADLDALQELPGIGPAIAERILAARQERMFTSLDDLERVPGIGPATLRRLRPHATVGRVLRAHPPP
jgi:competence ComEA-like helix-hairpin-helix protein